MITVAQKSSALLSFCKIYIWVLLCYSPFFCRFLWGNHDWEWVKTYTPLLSGVFEGRFTQFIIPTFFFSGNILPVFSIALGLFFYTLSTLLLLNLWHLPQKSTFFPIVAVTLITAPYTLSWFYFAFLTLSCLTWPLVIITAFSLLQYQNKKISIPASILLFTMALGGYPPVINLIGTVFFTLTLNDLCFNNTKIKPLIKNYLPHIFSIITSIALLFLIQYLLKAKHWQYDYYNTDIISLSALPQKLIISLKNAFYQFIYTTSFLENTYKYTSLILILLALWTMFKTLSKHLSRQIFLIICLSGLLLSSLATAIIAQNTAYIDHEPRIEFFSLPYIYAFAFIILIKQKEAVWRNFTFVALIIITLYNLNTTAYAAKIWNLGKTAEENLTERFIKRLEASQDFHSSYRDYIFIQSGSLNFRARYALPLSTSNTDSYTLNAPYIPWHLPSKAYLFYYPESFISKSFDTYWSFIPKREIPTSVNLQQYINQKARPWPHPDALYIKDNLIVLTLTADGNNRAQSWSKQHF